MADKAQKVSAEKEWISCRGILWYLVFSGFAISAMQRAAVGIAMIAMVIPRYKAPAVAQCAHNQSLPDSNLPNLWINSSLVANISAHNITSIPASSLEFTTMARNTTPVSSAQYPDRFAWNEYQQSLVLGGMYWLQWATQLPGGVLALRYGTKIIFGWANLATTLLGFLIPLCARYHLYAYVSVRVLQGAFVGLVLPAVHDLTAKWIPPNERSTFLTSYIGSFVGAAVTYPLSAMLINRFGWDFVFYFHSVIGLIWYVFWYYLAYDTPQEHPRISKAEKTYILKSLGFSVEHVSCTSRSVPWRAILTSGPVWLISIASLGGNWGVFTLINEAPTYFSYIHGWNINATGWLSALPLVMRMLFSYLFSRLADWLLKTERMSVTNLRKFATFVCNIVQGFLWLGLALSGCHPLLAIVFMTAGMAVGGATCAGTMASCVDLSPNYAGIISGIDNLVTVIPGFISPFIIGMLTNNKQTVEQWRSVYLIAVTIMLSTGVLFLFFGTSELQPWNSVGNEEKGEELQELRSNGGEVECDGVTDANVTRY